MPEKLTPEAEERIRSLCCNISVAHNLDEEIQRELFSHMEDKLLGYLSGEEKVTEEDAMILVREHLGNPAVIQGLFEEAHGMETRAGLFRRIGAVTVASLASAGVVELILLFIGIISDNNIRGAAAQYAIAWGHLLLPIFLLWGVLLFWRQTVSNVGKTWFYQLNPYLFSGIMVSLMFILVFIRYKFSFLPSPPMDRLEWLQVLRIVSNDFWPMVTPIFLQSMLWLWWFDSTPRKFREMLIGALAWVVYSDFNLMFGGIFGASYSSSGPFLLFSTACALAIFACAALGVYIVLSRLSMLRNKVLDAVSR